MSTIRTILPALAALLLLALVAPAAMAAPTTALAPVPTGLHPGRVSVGIGVGVGIPVAPPRRVVVRPPPPRGHYEIQVERVWVPGELIGYDVHGHAIYTRGYWTERHVRVWVPHVVRRGHVRRGHAHGHVHVVRPAPVTHVGFGVVVR